MVLGCLDSTDVSSSDSLTWLQSESEEAGIISEAPPSPVWYSSSQWLEERRLPGLVSMSGQSFQHGNFRVGRLPPPQLRAPKARALRKRKPGFYDWT